MPHEGTLVNEELIPFQHLPGNVWGDDFIGNDTFDDFTWIPLESAYLPLQIIPDNGSGAAAFHEGLLLNRMRRVDCFPGLRIQRKHQGMIDDFQRDSRRGKPHSFQVFLDNVLTECLQLDPGVITLQAERSENIKTGGGDDLDARPAGPAVDVVSYVVTPSRGDLIESIQQKQNPGRIIFPWLFGHVQERLEQIIPAAEILDFDVILYLVFLDSLQLMQLDIDARHPALLELVREGQEGDRLPDASFPDEHQVILLSAAPDVEDDLFDGLHLAGPVQGGHQVIQFGDAVREETVINHQPETGMFFTRALQFI